jgi:hypothetical protein
VEPGEAVQHRDVAALVVARPGSVRATGDPALPWVVADETGEPVEAVSGFLRYFLACGNSAASCRCNLTSKTVLTFDYRRRGLVRDLASLPPASPRLRRNARSAYLHVSAGRTRGAATYSTPTSRALVRK